MTWTVHWLKAGGDTGPWQSKIASQIEVARLAFGQLLPDMALDILLQRLPGAVIPELGMTGFALRGDLFTHTIDPDNCNFETALEEGGILRTAVHEAHHCARMRGPGYGRTLGEALVSEGLAGHYTLATLGGEPAPWETAVSGDLLRSYLPSQQELASPNYNHAAWFFGAEGVRPRWIGYTLGFRLVGNWLANEPNLSGARWAQVVADEILCSHPSVLEPA